MAKSKKDSNYYIDNKEFLKAMKEHRKNVLKAKRNNLPPPPVSDYIGECLIKIAQKLCNKPNFMSYTFKDDMILDGILNCLMYINNFNPRKSSNPFAYFTQIVWFAFLRRIQNEKKQLYTKFKSIDNVMLSDFYDDPQNRNIQAPTKYISDHSDAYMHEFIEQFEKTKIKNKPKKTKKKETLEKFIK